MSFLTAIYNWFIQLLTQPAPKPPVGVERPISEAEKTENPNHYWPKIKFAEDFHEQFEIHGKPLLNFIPQDATEWGFPTSLTPHKVAEFYCKLFSAMAKFESNYKEDLVYLEKFVDRKGKRVSSTGLLQMSEESCGLVYKYLVTTEELKQSKHNLACAIKVAAMWIPKDGVISGGKKNLGLGRYWSVMREMRKDIREKIRQMVIK